MVQYSRPKIWVVKMTKIEYKKKIILLWNGMQQTEEITEL